MKKTIIIFAVFLLMLSIPLVPAVEHRSAIETNKVQLKEKFTEFINQNTNVTPSQLIAFLIAYGMFFVLIVGIVACILRLITGNEFSRTIVTAFIITLIYFIFNTGKMIFRPSDFQSATTS
ncbi:MAG: hypothetical protein NT038_08450 [Euryarchaeota archaeon]|nr:hypothetical protein [Euryarchaeota archaeon]